MADKKPANNSLGMLATYMFDELDRLNALELSADNEAVIEQELKRSKAMQQMAGTVIDNSRVILAAAQMRADYMKTDVQVPKLLEG